VHDVEAARTEKFGVKSESELRSFRVAQVRYKTALTTS
jgi:hypothetical protein